MKFLSLAFLCCACIAVLSCGPAGNEPYTFELCDDDAADAGPPVSGGTLSLTQWAYMIQNDVSAVAGTTFDAIVMDYTKDGSDEPAGRYSNAEMSAIKDGGSRTAIAYLSIGEAEEYRWYFDSGWTDKGADSQPDSDAPCWLCRTNPDWAGNFKVQYWSDAWQTIVLAYVDKIIAYGFDGVYLDIIDGFEYWSDPQNGEGYSMSEAEAADRMINFVKRIAAHARAQKPDFLVIPQNGERILENAKKADYLAVINGIGIEDLFYDERTATTDSADRMSYIDQVTAVGKPALVVDYVYAVQDPPADTIVQDFLDKVKAKSGYCPYAARTNRKLGDLVIFAGQGE